MSLRKQREVKSQCMESLGSSASLARHQFTPRRLKGDAYLRYMYNSRNSLSRTTPGTLLLPHSH